MSNIKTSLVVPWLRLGLPIQTVCVPSLVGEARLHLPLSQKKNTNKQTKKTQVKTEAIVVTHLIDFRNGPHKKKKNLKKKTPYQKSFPSYSRFGLISCLFEPAESSTLPWDNPLARSS